MKSTPKYKLIALDVIDGMTLNDAAEKYGVRVDVVRCHLSHARRSGMDVPYLRKNVGYNSHEIADMRRRGMSVSDICKETGLTPNQVMSRTSYGNLVARKTSRLYRLQSYRAVGSLHRALGTLPPDALSRILLDMPDDMTIAEFAADLIRRTYATV